MEIEGPNNKKLDPEPLIDFIRANPSVKAVSSHTAVVSVPDYEDIQILPILFFRHPIDRIRSAYDFEKKQDAKTPGAIAAKSGDFKTYMDWRLSTLAPFQVMNFHASRLKDFYGYTPVKRTDLFLPRAKAALDALPVVGLVGQFVRSMQRFAKFIQPYFPGFSIESARENAASPIGHTLKDNVTAFRDRIGSEVFNKLRHINQIDFELYEYAQQIAKRDLPEDVTS